MNRILTALAVTVLAVDVAGADSYERELSLRLMVSGGQPRMVEERILVREENVVRSADNWVGSLSEATLARSLGGGLEVGYGILPWARFVLAVEGRAAYVKGTFEGEGPRTSTDPVLGLLREQAERVTRLTEGGVDAGATVLLSDFGWSRVGLVSRVGFHRLAGAFEKGEEVGQVGTTWWKRDLTGYASTGFLGLEWEVLGRETRRSMIISGFVMFGYRVLAYRNLKGIYTDSTGVRLKGDVRNVDGTHRILDFSGPEVRVGIQTVFPLSIERRFGAR